MSVDTRIILSLVFSFVISIVLSYSYILNVGLKTMILFPIWIPWVDGGTYGLDVLIPIFGLTVFIFSNLLINLLLKKKMENS